MAQNPVIVHNTITRWITSCDTMEQVEIAKKAVIKLFDEQFEINKHPQNDDLQRMTATLHKCVLDTANRIINTKK